MTILETFLDDLGRAPEDWDLRGVAADWAEDNGRPELAECLRWMVRQKKRPYPGVPAPSSWFNGEKVDPELPDHESNLPAAVYERLEGGTEVANHKLFPSPRAAEEALYAAWARARAGGWSP
jgi:uncharacterized protein (TIGR02996 family)